MGAGRPEVAGDLAAACRLTFAAAASAPAAERPVLLDRAQELAELSALAGAYRFLQRATGVLAVTLPFVLAVGNLVAGGTGLRGSISGYYYTHLGTYFVGSLFALGVFFFSYNYRPLPGYHLDNYLSDAAGLAAICVALFPTAEAGTDVSTGSRVVSAIHLGSACTLFVLLAVFALFRFTRTDDGRATTPAKRRRNVLYRVCGAVIAVTIVLVLLAQVFPPPHWWHSVFWLESVAVVAFGVSWLVKGGFLGILADR